MTSKSQPGEPASPLQMLSLADEYRRASDSLVERRRKQQPLSLAPFRLTAIHAIELYLTATLLAYGHQPQEIRGLGHDLSKRAALAQKRGLNLRKRTVEHLGALGANREYLVSRYAPELLGVASSQINRLLATLNEVAEKSAAMVALTETKRRPAPPCR